MTYWLLISDGGVNTQPVRADTPAELAAALKAQPPAESGSARVAAIELVTVASLVDGDVPQAFLTAQANRAELATKAQAALTANATFLALPAPTNAQVLAHTKLLTRELNAVIRLALGLLDTTADS